MKATLLPIRTLLVLLIGLSAGQAWAQEERLIVGTAPFAHAPSVPVEAADQIQAMVTGAVSENSRFTVVEVAQADAIDAELYAQGDEKYIDGIVTQVAPMGAGYLLLGMVPLVDIAPDRTTTGTMTYTARVNYALRMVSVGTREVICEDLIQTSTGSALKGAGMKILAGAIGESSEAGEELAGAALRLDTPEAALGKAINDTRSKVDAFITACFPRTFQIVRVEQEGKNGRIEAVLLAGDEGALNEGQVLRVVQQETIEISEGEAEIMETTVATIKVSEVRGDKFSVGTISGRRNQEKMRDMMQQGATLVVTTSTGN